MDINIQDVFKLASIRRIRLDLYLVNFAVQIEIIDIAGTHNGLQRGKHCTDRDIQHLGFFTVHVEEELRRTGAIGAVRPADTRILIGSGNQKIQCFSTALPETAPRRPAGGNPSRSWNRAPGWVAD